MASKQLGSLLKTAPSATTNTAAIEESTKKTTSSSTNSNANTLKSVKPSKQQNVPLQVLIPDYVREQVDRLCFENKESLRTVVLKGLNKLGLDIPKEDLQGRYRKH